MVALHYLVLAHFLAAVCCSAVDAGSMCTTDLSVPAVQAEADADPPLLRVMTYNVQKGSPVERIAADIQAHCPDIVLLQEADSCTRRARQEDQLPMLRDRLGMYGFYAASYVDDGGTTGQAILSRLALEDTQVVDLPHSRNIAAAATIRWRGYRIRLISTHWSATFRPSYSHIRESAEARLREAMRLAELVSQWRGEVILGGDLNCGPNSRPYDLIRQILQPAGPAAPTVPADAPLLPYDHVFISNGLRRTSAKVAEQGVSDHRAIVVELAKAEAGKATP